MKSDKHSTAIILPYKESFCNKEFGAVSIWVKDFIDNNKINNDLVFCRKIPNINNYLTKNARPIKIDGTIY